MRLWDDRHDGSVCLDEIGVRDADESSWVLGLWEKQVRKLIIYTLIRS